MSPRLAYCKFLLGMQVLLGWLEETEDRTGVAHQSAAR